MVRHIRSFSLAGMVALSLASAGARAQPAPCPAWEVEYTVAEKLRLSDTPMGKGDGTYTVGPGRLVLRFEDPAGSAGSHVQIVSYDIHEHFFVDTDAAFWNARVTTDVRTTGMPNACSIGEGELKGSTLMWTSPVRGYRTDGTMTCEGSLCGKFGAPDPGPRDLHIGPNPVTFGPFAFSSDMKSFTMPEIQTAQTESPKQTAHSAISGREVKRTCVARVACR
jgi:hypothetical protein